jgi:hypothetical protein
MRLKIREMAGFDVCTGAIAGRELLAKMLAATASEPDAPTLVLVDFQGIIVATASFLRESIIAFRDLVRGRRSNFYPVVTNPNGAISEELADILQVKGDALIFCNSENGSAIQDTRVVGRLEPKQRKILDLIFNRGELDATQLQKEFGDAEGVKQTAWNNRLAALSQAGLVMELSEGRSKRYKPLF